MTTVYSGKEIKLWCGCLRLLFWNFKLVFSLRVNVLKDKIVFKVLHMHCIWIIYVCLKICSYGKKLDNDWFNSFVKYSLYSSGSCEHK